MMRSFTLTACAVLALGASAAVSPELRGGFDVARKATQSEKMFSRLGLDKLPQEKVAALKTAQKQKRITPAATPGDIAGDYTITIGDYYFQDSAGEFDETATIEVNGNTAVISCDYFQLDVEAAYNASTNKLSFSSYALGPATVNGTTYYVQFEPFAWDAENGITISEYEVTFNSGTFSFPADHGFSWHAYTDADCTTSAGYIDIFDVLSMVKEDENADPNEGWTPVGNALLSDGWGLTLIGIDQTDRENWIEVELQQNDENENLYRLVNPFKGEHPLASYNTSTKNGYIQFDVTDPEHVVFDAVDAGLSVAQVGVSKFYCMNALTSTMGYFGVDAATVVSVLGDKIPYSTFSNGVVTLDSSLEADEEGAMNWSNDACFGIQGDIYGGYGWTDENDASANMATKIYFPGAADEDGVEGVNAAAADAPVKYFNLQGMGVTNPAKGEVVIRVQGEKVSKMLVK